MLWIYLSLLFANLNMLFLPKPLKCSALIVQNVLPLQINDLLKNIPFCFGNTLPFDQARRYCGRGVEDEMF